MGSLQKVMQQFPRTLQSPLISQSLVTLLWLNPLILQVTYYLLNYYKSILIYFHFRYIEYVLSTVDQVVNWSRQGSIWPMVKKEYFDFLCISKLRINYGIIILDFRFSMLCRYCKR